MTQIPFFHGTVLSLSSDASQLGPSRIKEYLPILLFVALLIHAALFYFIGSNFPLFIFFIWVLFSFNAVWLSVSRLIVPIELVVPEWIQLNSITSAFLFGYFFYPYFIDINYTISDDFSSNFILLVVLTSRSILDYVFGWRNFYQQVQS